MKKLVGLTAIVILFSLTISAQGKKERVRKGTEFTTEQQAILHAKKLAMTLELDANQQKAVTKLIKERADYRKKMRETYQQNRQDGVQLSSDERFKLQNDRLDKQLEHQVAMKKILNEEQYEKWTKINKVQKRKGQEKMNKRRAGAKNKSKGQRDGQRNDQLDN